MFMSLRGIDSLASAAWEIVGQPPIVYRKSKAVKDSAFVVQQNNIGVVIAAALGGKKESQTIVEN